MVNNVLLERVAHLVHIVHMHLLVVGVHLAATLIDGHKHRFDAAGGLCHERCGACGSNRQTGDIATTMLHHVVVELWVGLAQTVHKRVVGLTLSIIDGKGTTFLSHGNRRAIGVERQGLLHANGKIGGLLGAITQPHGGYHVALCGNAHSRATSQSALMLDFLPQMVLGVLHVVALRIIFDLLHDQVDLLHLEIHNVVHDALGHANVSAKLVVIEARCGREGVLHIAIEIEAEQSTTVVGAEWNLATGIGRNRAEPQIGIAIGDALTQDGVPKEHAGLGTLPSVVHNLMPKVACRYFLAHHRLVGIYREPLHIGLVGYGGLHESVVDLHAYIGSRHLALGHLGVDEALGVGVLHAHREHQRSAASVLRHLTCGVAVALHKRNQACTGQSRVVDRASLGPQLVEVVPHTTASLHELHLLLIDLHDGAVGIGVALQADDKAVA